MYIIRSPVNNVSFVTSFQILIPITSFFCLITLAMTSSTLLSRAVPAFRGNMNLPAPALSFPSPEVKPTLMYPEAPFPAGIGMVILFYSNS